MQKKRIVAPSATKQKKHIIPYRTVSGLIRFVLKDVLREYQQTKDQSIK